MASGIDTSARFISLALNIAVMGFILVEGIASFLRRQLPPAIDAAQLRSLAEQLTTGTAPTIGQGRGRVDRSRRNGQASAGPRFRLGDAVWRGQRLAVRAGQLAGVRRATRGAPDRRGSSVQ